MPVPHVPPLHPVPGSVLPHAAPLQNRPAILLAVEPSIVTLFPSSAYTRLPVHTTADAMLLIEQLRPAVVVVDWDLTDVAAAEVCAAARRFDRSSVLVITGAPERAPAALKAGCHGVLLKPFAPALAASRLGRLCPSSVLLPNAAVGYALPCATNRVWPDTSCPRCRTPGATSFEFASYRRMWYACLSCEEAWLGPRQE